MQQSWKMIVRLVRCSIVASNVIFSVLGMTIIVMSVLLNSWNKELLDIAIHESTPEPDYVTYSSDSEQETDIYVEEEIEGPMSAPIITCLSAGIAMTIVSALGYWGACCKFPLIILIHVILLAPLTLLDLAGGISLVIFKDTFLKGFKNVIIGSSPCERCAKLSNALDQVSRPLAGLLLIVGTCQFLLLAISIFYFRVLIWQKHRCTQRTALPLTSIESESESSTETPTDTTARQPVEPAQPNKANTPENVSDSRHIAKNRDSVGTPTPPTQYVFKRYLTPKQLESAPLTSIPRVSVTLSTPPIVEEDYEEYTNSSKVITAPPPPPPPSTPTVATVTFSRPTVPSFVYDSESIARLQTEL